MERHLLVVADKTSTQFPEVLKKPALSRHRNEGESPRQLWLGMGCNPCMRMIVLKIYSDMSSFDQTGSPSSEHNI